MTCPKVPAKIDLFINHENILKFFSFEGIKGAEELSSLLLPYCHNKKIDEIISLKYEKVIRELMIQEEEKQFSLYLQLDGLKCALAHYIGFEDNQIDSQRCVIEEIEHNEEGCKMIVIMLPPQKFPVL